MGKGTPEGSGRFIGPSGRSRKGWGPLGQVRDGSGDPSKGLGGYVGPSSRSGKGRGTILEVRNGSGDPG